MFSPKRFKMLAELRGFKTQTSLSYALRMPQPTLSRLMSETRPSNPKMGTLAKIAQALNCRVADLIE